MYEGDLGRLRAELGRLPDLRSVGSTIELHAANLAAVNGWKATIDDLAAAVDHPSTTIPAGDKTSLCGVCSVCAVVCSSVVASRIPGLAVHLG